MKSKKPYNLNLKQKKEPHSKDKSIENSKADNLKVIQELQVYKLELEMQNEELRLAQELAQTAYEKYNEYYDFAPSGFITVNRKGEIVELNQMGAKMLDKPRSALKNSLLCFFVSESLRPVFNKFLNDVFTSHSKETCEVSLADSSPITVHLEGYVGENKELCLLTMIDITDRKEMEKELRDNENRMNDIVFSMADWVWELDENGCYTYSSSRGSELLGAYREEIIGKTPFDFMPPEDAKRVSTIFSKIAANKAPIVDLENWNIGKNGKQICFLTNGVPILDIEGNLKGYRGVDKDITKRKQVEEALQKSELNFRTLFEQIAVGVALLETETGRYIRINQKYCDIIGYTVEEMLHKTFHDVTYPDDIQTNIDNNVSLINGTIAEFSIEKRYIHKNGTLKWGKLTVSPLWKFGKQTDSFFHIAVVEDITESKHLHEKLKESEKKFRLLFQNLPSGFALHEIILDENGHPTDYRFLEINPAFEKLTGLKAKNIIGKTSMEVLPNNESYWIDTYSEVALTGKQINFENYSRELGKHFQVSSYSSEHGKFATIFEDITERKQAEEKVRENDIKFRKLSANIPDLVFQFTRRLNGTYYVPIASVGIINIFGCYPEDVVDDFTPIAKVIYPEDADRVISDIEYSAKNLTNFTCEFRVQIPGKPIQWIYSRSTPEKLDDGSITWYGFNTDITERKAADEVLRKSEQEFRAMAESMPQIVWVTRADGWNIYFNQQWVEYTGLTLEESYGSGWNKPFHPDDRQRAWDAWLYAISNKGTYSIEARLRRFDGEYRWWLVRGVPLLNENGEILKWFGTCTDIESIKQTQEENIRMQESLEKLRQHQIDIRENERALISREIHDQLGQSLTALKIDLNWIQARKTSNQKETDKLNGMVEMVTNTIKDVQRISSELRPAILDDLGLAAAIEWYSDEFASRTGLEVIMELDDVQSQNMNKNLALFRVLQESLTNIIRHANAHTVIIKLNMIESDLVLFIEDDGIGILKEQIKSTKSLGLQGMIERIKQFEGHIDISASANGGTIVKIFIPI